MKIEATSSTVLKSISFTTVKINVLLNQVYMPGCLYRRTGAGYYLQDSRNLKTDEHSGYPDVRRWPDSCA
jgi:hypothetical protein